MAELIFMLTHHDRTVPDARSVFEQVRGTGLKYVGFKDVGSHVDELRSITEAAHSDGLEVMLETVSVVAEEELQAVKTALEIGVDWVIGGTNTDGAQSILAGSQVHYAPFAGTIVGHPSVLKGSIEDIVADARELTSQPGIEGIDLLAYRHPDEDPVKLTAAVAAAVPGPVIAAGSIESEAQIEAVSRTGAWGFTMGGAIFERTLVPGADVRTQVEAALRVARKYAEER